LILETSRLTLRQLVPEDLDFLAGMLADPDVSRFYERRFQRRDAEVWLERQLERYRHDGHGLWLLQDRNSGEPLGQVGLALQEVEGTRLPEIGWMLHRHHWGRGYATEAAAATRDAAFTRWGYPAVISLIRPVNLPSQRVAIRIGMAPEREADFHGFRHIVFAVRAPVGTGPKSTDE
jgi:RimJ/RimL family protein N-acetyltransferase